jgi:hypothetical protein
MTTNSLDENLQLIARKSGKTISEVRVVYETALTNLPSSLSEKQRTRYALKKTNSELAINTKSDAITYEGIIIAEEEQRDLMKKSRDDALKAYQENPQEAINSGLIRIKDGEFEVLDNRQTLPDGSDNPKFGKPRPKHMFIKTAIIAARIPSEKKFVCGKITLWNEKSNLKLPKGKLVSFKALGGINEETGELELRSSKDTAFEIKDEIPREELIRIIDDAFVDKLTDLGDCERWFEENKNKFDAYVVTEGTLKFNPSLATDDTSNHRLVLDDNSLPEGHPMITCWVPNKLRGSIQYGKGSIVTIFGKVRMSYGWDNKLKQKTEDLQPSITALAIFGRPGLTTPLTTHGDEF